MTRFKVALIANDGHKIPEWVWQRFEEENIDFIYYDCHSTEDLKNNPLVYSISLHHDFTIDKHMYVAIKVPDRNIRDFDIELITYRLGKGPPR